MKVILPDHIGDITLGQYQKWLILDARTDLTKLEHNKRKLCIFTNLKYREVAGIMMKDYDHLLKKIDTALELTPPFQNRFEMDGIEFGFIPNFNKLSTVEYGDLLDYEKDPQDLHLMMAILYRPVKVKDAFGNYSIELYNGTEKYGMKMKEMPLSLANSVNSFFLTLRNELLMSTQNSILLTMRDIRLERDRTGETSLLDGAGIQV